MGILSQLKRMEFTQKSFVKIDFSPKRRKLSKRYCIQRIQNSFIFIKSLETITIFQHFDRINLKIVDIIYKTTNNVL